MHLQTDKGAAEEKGSCCNEMLNSTTVLPRILESDSQKAETHRHHHKTASIHEQMRQESEVVIVVDFVGVLAIVFLLYLLFVAVNVTGCYLKTVFETVFDCWAQYHVVSLVWNLCL